MKNKLIELAKRDNISLEINEQSSKNTEINILNDQEKSFQITNIKTYTLKAIKNNKCVKMVTENLKNTKEIIDNLNNLFLIQENDNKNRLSKGILKNKLKNKEIINYNKVKKDLISLNKLKKQYPLLTNLDIYYSHREVGKSINNIDSNMSNEYYYNEYLITISLEKNDITKSEYINYYSNNYDFEGFRKIIIEKIESLVLKLNSESCKTNKYNVILTNEVLSDILETFIPMFNSKNITLKDSYLTDKFNKKVFSDKLTIIEDPMLKTAIINELFDTEGTRTTYKELIKNGVFSKKINSLEYAIKNNEDPTGNAGCINNLYIKPGNKDFSDLIKILDNGIIIDRVEGLHAGIEIRNGNISLQSEGFLVKNGKIEKTLNMIILSTNLNELFNNIVEIGNDFPKTKLEIFSPSILFKNITIAGSEINE